ncbi:MAG TPA: hypothetical protein VGK54_11435 [Chloroflexota bacterium]|jgi:hypothetical protein
MSENGKMTEQAIEPTAEDTLRAEARTWIYERLALASAVIYIGGTGLMFVFYVPFIENPYRYFTIAALVPLLPAALPWLFFRYLTGRRARKLIAEQAQAHP